eukprot:2209241-Prymnesium_polylepis.1
MKRTKPPSRARLRPKRPGGLGYLQLNSTPSTPSTRRVSEVSALNPEVRRLAHTHTTLRDGGKQALKH